MDVVKEDMITTVLLTANTSFPADEIFNLKALLWARCPGKEVES